MKYFCVPNLTTFICVLALLYECSSRYDSSTAQFDPTGRILQLEYAKNKIFSEGGPVSAIRCNDGIIMAAAKLVPKNKLLVSSIKKYYLVDKHVSILASGQLLHSVMVVKAAKDICAKYKDVHSIPIPLENLCSSLCDSLHVQTLEASIGYGASFLVAGWDNELGPQVYTIEPDGSFTGWNAAAIGMKSDKVMGSLSNIGLTSKSNSIESVWPKFKSLILDAHFSPSVADIDSDDAEEVQGELENLSLTMKLPFQLEKAAKGRVWEREVSLC